MTKVMLKPMTMSQNVHLPSRSESMRPLIFGNQYCMATDDCEDDRAYRHKVKMCDEEVAVLSLPIECHAGMTDSGEARDKELDEKRDADTTSALEIGCGRRSLSPSS